MNTKKHLCRTACIVFMCLFSALKGVAQDNKQAPAPTNWTIEVKGQVTENDKKLHGAVISVLEGGSTVNTVNSSDGKFDFQLQAGNDYVITFSKPGYITKRISFSTKNVPADRGKYGFTPFTIDEVDIFPEVPGTDVDQILQQPIAKINFEPKYHNGDFNFDERYTQSIQSVLDKILAAKKALDAKYKKLISTADDEFNKQTYNEAKNNYTEALKLKPNEKYPKDQLAAIEKALKEQKEEDAKKAKEAAAEKAVHTKYDSIIKLADAAYGANKYNDAKKIYEDALNVISGERYPKAQISKIDKILAQQKKAEDKALKEKRAAAEYDSIVKAADKTFHRKEYDAAKASYKSAEEMKPEKDYPKQQIALIERIENVHKKPVAKDSLAKAKKQQQRHDTAKPKPVVHVNVSPCNIRAMGDSCRPYLRPFLYESVNALHLPIKKEAQEKEVNFPTFSGQRYRLIINISAMPQGTTVIVYDKDNRHKNRKVLYSAGDAAHRISTFDTDPKGDRLYIDYEIPPNSGPPTSGCAVIMFGYENAK